MKIKNAKIFIDRQFIDGSIEFEKNIKNIIPGKEGAKGRGIDKAQNAGTESDILDAKGAYLIPGLIDIHTHGALGEDASDGSVEGLEKMSVYYAKEGVTSWLPTTMTLKEPELTKAVKAIKDFSRPTNGAKAAGIHLEGPFLSYAKRGAQAAENLHKPDIEFFNRLNEASGGIVKQVTVAPEEEGAVDFIREASKICNVSIGHTTADYATAMAGYLAGAKHATHLYNGMPGLAHRESGVIGAAFDAGATVELITDGLHIDGTVIRMTYSLFGDKLVLISDSLRCAGMPDGDYELGGQPITMKNGKATLTGTDTLAGSSIHLMEGLRRSVGFGIPLEAAVYAASTAPAKAVGLDGEIGSIVTGKCADMVLLDKDLKVVAVFVDGEQVG